MARDRRIVEHALYLAGRDSAALPALPRARRRWLRLALGRQNMV
jgi:hypothetical protein